MKKGNAFKIDNGILYRVLKRNLSELSRDQLLLALNELEEELLSSKSVSFNQEKLTQKKVILELLGV